MCSVSDTIKYTNSLWKCSTLKPASSSKPPRMHGWEKLTSVEQISSTVGNPTSPAVFVCLFLAFLFLAPSHHVKTRIFDAFFFFLNTLLNEKHSVLKCLQYRATFVADKSCSSILLHFWALVHWHESLATWMECSTITSRPKQTKFVEIKSH